MSTPVEPPGLEDVQVWQVRLDVETDELGALAAALTADERERANRFTRPCDAARSVAARGHLRRILGRYLDCSAAAVGLETGLYGKPYITTPGGGWLRFNLSHSGDRALIAVANGREVGVDIERIQPELADPSLAKLFTPAEQQTLADLTRDEYVRGCFRLWTRKEAVVKGLGVGLSVPLDGVDVSDDDVTLAPAVADCLHPGASLVWTVRSLGSDTAYAAGLAVEGRPATEPAIRGLNVHEQLPRRHPP